MLDSASLDVSICLLSHGRWGVHHGIARWLGGEFREKMKFVVFEM